MGLDAFRRLVNDPRFSGLPMLLETPKSARQTTAKQGRVAEDPMDRANLALLGSLVA